MASTRTRKRRSRRAESVDAGELSPRQLGELRERLKTAEQEARGLLADDANAAGTVTLDQQSVGRVSRIDAIQQQQMAIAGQDQAIRQLRQIEQALKRMDSGDFGYCQSCGEPIRFERLRAQPFASLCLDCQARAERR